MDALKYWNILQQHMLPHTTETSDLSALQRSQHTSRLVEEWLSNNNTIVLELPAQNFDFNRIEELSEELERRSGRESTSTKPS